MTRWIFFKLWPALIPIAIYLLWYAYKRYRYRKTGEKIYITDGPWIITLLCALVIAIIMLFGVRIFHEPAGDGVYQPAHIENGELVDGEITKRP